MHPSPDVLALLALGEPAGTEAEREHVESCAECYAEVEALASVARIGRLTSETDTLLTPSDRVWQAVRAELSFDEPPGPDSQVQVERSPGPRRPTRVLSLALAAVLALIVGIGFGIAIDRLIGPRQTTLWSTELQALPDWAGSSGQARVVENSRGERTLIVELTSTDPADGSRQVWLINRAINEMTGLGYLTDGRGEFAIPQTVDPRQFPVVDVSEEPPNDSDVRHSGNSIVRGTLNV